jgi:hypothetical protein
VYRGRNLHPPPGTPPQTVTDILEYPRIVGWEEKKFGLPSPTGRNRHYWASQTVTDRALLDVTDLDRQSIIGRHRP